MKHVLSALAAAGVMIALGMPSALAQSNGEVGPGCDPARPAVAYHAGGTALKQHNGNLPIPCAVVTGFTMETATVGVIQSDGTLGSVDIHRSQMMAPTRNSMAPNESAVFS
jgi:hypothetical protein